MKLVFVDMAEWDNNAPPSHHKEIIDYYSNRAIANFDSIVYGGIYNTYTIAGDITKLGSWTSILAVEGYQLIWLSYRADKVNSKVLGRIMIYAVKSIEGLNKLMAEYGVYQYYAKQGITDKGAVFREIMNSVQLNVV